MPNLSIITPIYNTQKYLNRCLDSLINQTLKDIEIICINDCSTDNSLEILKEYQNKDKRIKIINLKENKKQGYARNIALNKANGEYIGFIDSDDWIDLNYFEKLYTKAKEHNCDIALATNVRIGKNKYKKRLNITKEEIAISLKDKINLCNQWKNECPTNKIYKKELLINNNITFSEGCFCEDKIFTTKAIYYSNKIISVPDIYYYYFENPTSTVNSKAKKHAKELINDKNKAKKEVINFLRQNNVSFADGKYWALEKEWKIFHLTILALKRSLYREGVYLFNFLPFFQRRLNEAA